MATCKNQELMATCKNQDLLTFLQGGHKSIKVPFEKNILHKLSGSMHNNNNNKFKIEERRRQVASLLAQYRWDNIR
jgi:hypothetical protein